MSQESQGQGSTNNDIIGFEHQPTVTAQAVAISQGSNDTKGLEPSQADICRAQIFAPQYTSSEGPQVMEETSDHASNTTVPEIGSMSQSVHLNPDSASLPEDDPLKASAVSGAQGNSNQNIASDNKRLSPQVERILLDAIRDEMLFRIGATPKGAQHIEIYDFQTRPTRLQFGISVDEIAELPWGSVSRAMKAIDAARVERMIRGAWPKSRGIPRVVEQYIVESDGLSPAIKAQWSSVGKVYQDELDAAGRNLFARIRSRDILCFGYESLWHSWCYASRSDLRTRRDQKAPMDTGLKYRPRGKIIHCTSEGRRKAVQMFRIDVFACALSYDEPFSKPFSDTNFISDRRNFHMVGYSASFFYSNFRGGWEVRFDHVEQTALHWQIRYFRPISENEGTDINHLLSKRQTAAIQHGTRAISLQEQRARISFRVLDETPGLFSILILADEPMFPDLYETDSVDKVKANWERYGLKAKERTVPITHYLFEICRVFGKCMDAWGEALDAIDGLIHVSLDDFDDPSRVEDLMFDRSFDRSKDYFVALQLLRVMDEWIDEIVLSVKELREHPMVEHLPLCAAEANNNFDATIKNMKERAEVVQKRIRKKQEEINSLRDGLFNATSLREATKAMSLNQAIYIFTFVTVLFTPISFLATFWALPFLNNPAEGSDTVPEPSAFRNSFIVVPLLTYALVTGVAWFMGQRNGTNALLGLLREVWEILGQLLRTAWSLLPRIPRRGSGRSPYP
ncbi:hypothetical protein FOMA001_g11862 [Fusarium oxysporum f. sp. matthiolae]|nr:hypothetical protein FOMA001_g11862 [Fusarium oxysporum f. sp. matthiolae]